MSIKSIRDREKAATPGPWGWTGNLRLRWVELSTLHSGRLGVMRFVRWGMGGAQPIFLDPDSRAHGIGAVTTVKASDVPVFEVCRDATSADDPRVYRQDIIGIRHPDAAFIAAARRDVPALLLVAEAASEVISTLVDEDSGAASTEDVDAALDALARALEALEALP